MSRLSRLSTVLDVDACSAPRPSRRTRSGVDARGGLEGWWFLHQAPFQLRIGPRWEAGDTSTPTRVRLCTIRGRLITAGALNTFARECAAGLHRVSVRETRTRFRFLPDPWAYLSLIRWFLAAVSSSMPSIPMSSRFHLNYYSHRGDIIQMTGLIVLPSSGQLIEPNLRRGW